MDLNHSLYDTTGRTVDVPCAFVCGTADGLFRAFGGAERIRKDLGELCPAGCTTLFIEGVGHWIQQEAAAECSAEILRFANEHRARFAPSRAPTGVGSRL